MRTKIFIILAVIAFIAVITSSASAQKLWISSWGDNSYTNGSLANCNLDGTGLTNLGTFSRANVCGITYYGGKVYVAISKVKNVFGQPLGHPGTIERYLIDGSFDATFFGPDALMNDPMDLDVDSGGNLYLASNAQGQVFKILADATAIESYSTWVNNISWHQTGIAFNPIDSKLYVAEQSEIASQVYRVDGVTSPTVIFSDTFALPFGIIFDSNGKMFVCDREGNNIKRYALSGSTWVYDNLTLLMSAPTGLTWGPEDSPTLYVVSWNTQVVKFQNDGTDNWTKTIIVNGGFGNRGIDIKFVPAASTGYSLTCTVNLGDYGGDVTTVPVTVELNGTPIALNLDADSKFTILDVANGTYDVKIKASHWLAKVIPGVAVTADTIMSPVDLTNGDVVDNNEVDFSDINAARAAYGSFPGDETWNEMADVDGSMEVDFTDINIVRGKYGEIGD